MKQNALIILCTLILTKIYADQKCYICDKSACEHPTEGDVKVCSYEGSGETDGKDFVSGALKENDTNNIYNKIETDLTKFAADKLGINGTEYLTLSRLAHWVCYITKDKHRGCLLMAKGFCSKDKSWLGKITSVAKKLTSVLKKAKDIMNSLFSDPNVSAHLNSAQKFNISNWFAENYMNKLISNSDDPQYQLDSCCEGNQCNHGSMIKISTILFIVSIILII